jgi:UDP-N-acetylglucosamine 2-epimerase (non-hydrolysing)
MAPDHRRVLVVLGTRPEAVKLAPVVLALQDSRSLTPIVVATGQHQSLVAEVLDVFGVHVDHDLALHSPGQTLTDITTECLRRLDPLLGQVKPDAVIVQGDTTSTFAAALASFYAGVPVAHVEAGLRTDDPRSPFPEELNRRLTTEIATLHLAPTTTAVRNLLRQGVARERIALTGNTVIDALQRADQMVGPLRDPWLSDLETSEQPVVLVTVHRRESWGAPLRRIAEAVAEVASQRPDCVFVVPAHPNPDVRRVLDLVLTPFGNVRVGDPVGYPTLVRLLRRSRVVLTDSGGLQEEAPAFGVPVLVTRDRTERPEAIEAGVARLVGTESAAVIGELRRLLEDDAAHATMARAVNPFGDGHAAVRCVAAVEALFGLGSRLPEFLAAPAA